MQKHDGRQDFCRNDEGMSDRLLKQALVRIEALERQNRELRLFVGMADVEIDRLELEDAARTGDPSVIKLAIIAINTRKALKIGATGGYHGNVGGA